MTCTGCEKHIEKALESMGALNAKADFSQSEAVFQLPDDYAIENAIEAVKKINYQPEEVEKLPVQKRVMTNNKEDYDLLIIGSGGAAFSAAIKAVEYGSKVGMIERGTVGGTCVNIGCIPSKTLLRAGEINQSAHVNIFEGLHTSTGEVELDRLVDQKNELVDDLRKQKYTNLIDDYGLI